MILHIVISYTGAVDFTKFKYTLSFDESNTLTLSMPNILYTVIYIDRFMTKYLLETTQKSSLKANSDIDYNVSELKFD